MEPLDPALLDRDDVRAALVARDIGAVYRLLWQAGVTQHRIARLTGQSQSEVSEILGQVLLGLGEPIELALPPGAPLPSRLGMSHVHVVRAFTERLCSVARYYGGQADLFAAATTIYTRWMEIPAPEAVKTRLAAALAELHTEAGWCCHDSGVDGTGCFTRALRLADEGADTYGIANATWHAGLTLVRTGHPNDALKLFQLGRAHLGGFAPGKPTPATMRAEDPRIPTIAARLARSSATAYALLGNTDQATRCLAEANDEWAPRDAFEHATADSGTAGIHLDLGQLEGAEQFAASAVRIFDEVSTLQSIAMRRQRLMSLVTAPEARPGTDTQELAQIARQVATTQI